MQLHLHCVRSKKHKNNLKLNDPIIHLKQEEAEMKEFLLPYGKEKLTAKIEDEHLAGVLLSELHSYKAPKSGAELVQDALEHPIGTPRLCDMAVGKKKVVVISSDHTRPVPSHIMMPILMLILPFLFQPVFTEQLPKKSWQQNLVLRSWQMRRS